MGIRVTGLFGFLILIANIWAIVNVVQSRESSAKMVFWIVLILIFPLVGFLAWLFVGPRARRRYR